MSRLPLRPAEEQEALAAYLKRTSMKVVSRDTYSIPKPSLEKEVWSALSSIVRLPRGGVHGNGSHYGRTTPLRGLPRELINNLFTMCDHYPGTRFGQDELRWRLTLRQQCVAAGVCACTHAHAGRGGK